MLPARLRRLSLSSSAKAADPVRRGLSVLSWTSLGYWITRRSLSSGGHSADPLAGDDSWMCVRLLATHCARGLLEFSLPSNQRARGMSDARCTRDLMRNCAKVCAHEHTGQRRTSDIPCAMALRLITRSPRSGRARCHRCFLQVKAFRLLGRQHTGRRDHASSPYARASARHAQTLASIASPSHVRDDGQRPSERDGMGEDMLLISISVKPKYFLFWGLTFILNIRSNLPQLPPLRAWMGRAKRYPSLVGYEGDGFRRGLNPSYNFCALT
jgi:hypothetical protein